MIAGQAIALAYRLVGKISQDSPNRPDIEKSLEAMASRYRETLKADSFAGANPPTAYT